MARNVQKILINTIQEQQAHWLVFATKAFESSIKLYELNMKMAQESLSDSVQSIQAMSAIKSPDELLICDVDHIQSNLNRTMAYAKSINEVMSALSLEFSQLHQAQWSRLAEVNTLAQTACPPASESMQQPFDLLFDNLKNATNGYRQWMDVGKKIAEVVGHNLSEFNEPATTKRSKVSTWH